MTRMLRILAFFFAVIAATASAHEVRPAYLEITRSGPTSLKVVWKQPTMGDIAVHLVPHISNGWLERQPSDQYAAAGFLIRTWTIAGVKPIALAGQTIRIEGLEDTITDTLLRIRLANGQRVDAILRPESPSYLVSLTDGNAMAASAFLTLGVQHILMGPDHLLFVLALLLIVRDRWTLIKTVSSFTLAHSITLALATFGAISLSMPLLNALVAFSILFVAPEVVRAQRGGTSLTIRYPWVVAFAFGLLHGLGFASGLTSLGLDRTTLLTGLVLFNIGVEIGQLAFIALVFALRRAFRLMEFHWPRVIADAPTYAIGIMGAYWTILYSAALFGAP